MRRNADHHNEYGGAYKAIILSTPAGNGWPIGRNAGHLHTGVNGGSTLGGFRRRRSRRTTSVLTPTVEIIDGNY
jgi:hypothetical protein